LCRVEADRTIVHDDAFLWWLGLVSPVIRIVFIVVVGGSARHRPPSFSWRRFAWKEFAARRITTTLAGGDAARAQPLDEQAFQFMF
jgi:hypothetical protein